MISWVEPAGFLGWVGPAPRTHVPSSTLDLFVAQKGPIPGDSPVRLLGDARSNVLVFTALLLIHCFRTFSSCQHLTYVPRNLVFGAEITL